MPAGKVNFMCFIDEQVYKLMIMHQILIKDYELTAAWPTFEKYY
jgi:hypothetical protein